jgi:hypothetical protein
MAEPSAPYGLSDFVLDRMESDGWTPTQVRELIAEHRRLKNFHAIELDVADLHSDPLDREKELALKCAQHLASVPRVNVEIACEAIAKTLGRYRLELEQQHVEARRGA